MCFGGFTKFAKQKSVTYPTVVEYIALLKIVEKSEIFKFIKKARCCLDNLAFVETLLLNQPKELAGGGIFKRYFYRFPPEYPKSDFRYPRPRLEV